MRTPEMRGEAAIRFDRTSKREPPGGGEAQQGGDSHRKGRMEQLKLFNLPQTEMTSDDYWTPKWLFDTLGLQFDLDVACPSGGPVHTPARHYYTQETDGLTSPWFGRVWMNPPYSQTTPWIRKWLTHANGVCLVPIVKSQWFFDLWDSEAAIVRADPDKSGLKFERLGKEQRIMPNVVLCALGTENIAALQPFGKVR